MSGECDDDGQYKRFCVDGAGAEKQAGAARNDDVTKQDGN
jgi:hypothetical protein